FVVPRRFLGNYAGVIFCLLVWAGAQFKRGEAALVNPKTLAVLLPARRQAGSARRGSQARSRNRRPRQWRTRLPARSPVRTAPKKCAAGNAAAAPPCSYR